MRNRDGMRGIATLAFGAAFVLIAGAAMAQTEDELRGALEGQEVRLKIDMPGSTHGVDVYPQRKPAIKFDEYNNELKRYGVAIKKDGTSRITKVKVRDKHIEFQLDGGGASSMGAPTWTPTTKSARETELEFKPDRTGDESRELDGLRRRREAEDARSKEEHERAVTAWRTSSGSRFNLRFESKITAAELTPDAVRAALQEYVQFGGGPAPTAGAAAADPQGEKQTAPLVVMIKGELAGDETIGAGIIVGTGNDRMYIVTANHVVRRKGTNIQQLRVLFKWLPGEWTPAKLLETADDGLDLAVLSVENLKSLSADHLKFDRIAPGAPRVQQPVFFVGHGGSETWHTRRAPDAISGVSGDAIRFQSAFLTPGDSGGALVSDGWRIIGMLRSDQAGEANALSMQRIIDKLQEWNYPVTLRADGS
jgi:S1-C subfamily serine protease